MEENNKAVAIFEGLVIDNEGNEKHILFPCRNVQEAFGYYRNQGEKVIAVSLVGGSQLLKYNPNGVLEPNSITEIEESKEK